MELKLEPFIQKGKVAVVTGGGARIGRAISLALAKAGCDIFIHYSRSSKDAEETQKEIAALGRRAEIYQADFSDPRQVAQVIPAALAIMGRVDVLINNAAILLLKDAFGVTGSETWDRMFAINSKAPYFLMHAFAEQLPEDRTGRIININDASIPKGYPDYFAYRLSKKLLWEMTTMTAQLLAPQITVNQVALGGILAYQGDDEAAFQERVAERNPLGRAGTPEEVAQNTLHLIQQPYLNGVTIALDGGEFL